MSVVVKGVDELIAKMANLSSQGLELSRAIVSSVADNIVSDAKDAAPADLGTIRQNISQTTDTTGLKAIATVISSAPESAFQEFGTGGKVDVPEEMADVAAQFQGASGGDMTAFIKALTDWVRRHGLTGVYSVKTQKRITNKTFTKEVNSDADEQVAWAIAKTILRDGLKPQPFLYPAFVKNSVNLLPMLETGLKQLLANAKSN